MTHSEVDPSYGHYAKKKNYEDNGVKNASFMNWPWWRKIDSIIQYTKLMHETIHNCHTEYPSIHLVHEMLDSMIKSELCNLSA